MRFIRTVISALKRKFIDKIPLKSNPEEKRGNSTYAANYGSISSMDTSSIQIEPGKRVLVVEDNSDSRDLLTKLMQMSGFESFSASDGLRALEFVSEKKPDLILTDINMPNMNGLELIRKLKQHKTTADIPIIALTAYGVDIAREAIAEGALAYAEKPFDFDKLLGAVKFLIAGSPFASSQENTGPTSDLIVPVKQSIVLVNERLAHRFKNDPKALRNIDPIKFEELVAELFEDDGYEVIVTPPRADGGKDIYVYKKDPITDLMFLVECKRYTPPNTVGVGIARQLYGVVQHERANGGIIVTTSYFTKPAKDFAAGVPYQLFLRDFDYLSDWIKRAKKP